MFISIFHIDIAIMITILNKLTKQDKYNKN